MAFARFTAELYLALTLGIAGVSKMDNIPAFMRQISAINPVFGKFSFVLGRLIPLLEVVISVMLSFGALRKLVLPTVFALFSVFFAVKYNIYKRKSSDSCGCYSYDHGKLTIEDLSVAMIYVVVSFLVLKKGNIDSTDVPSILRNSTACTFCGLLIVLLFRVHSRHHQRSKIKLRQRIIRESGIEPVE